MPEYLTNLRLKLNNTIQTLAQIKTFASLAGPAIIPSQSFHDQLLQHKNKELFIEHGLTKAYIDNFTQNMALGIFEVGKSALAKVQDDEFKNMDLLVRKLNN